MTVTESAKDNPQEKPRRMLRKLVGGGVKVLLSVLIIAGAIAIYRYQIRTSPRAGRKKPPTQAKLVQVIPVQKDNCTTMVTAMGTVMPAQQVTLRPQVTGQLIEVAEDIVPGGIVRAGQKLIAIDHRDYEILIRQRHSDVVKAIKDLKVEQGNQAVAKQEYELLGEVVAEEDRELLLRQPQLDSVQSALESAQAALEKARLDLARCTIAVPFNAIVRQKHVDVGATVSGNSELVALIGTDEVWIEVMVPIHQLKWLDIPLENGDIGASVTIHNITAWGNDRFRTGRVMRLCGELETQGRMAKLLVAVDDPFCLETENHNQPKLLMGSYVRADIEGRTLASVFPIKRSHLRDNDTVWIMDGREQLEIRPVKIAFRGPDHVYVTEGLAENEKLVVTDIAAPVAGMPLEAAGAEDENEQRSGGIPDEEETQLLSEGGRR